MTLFFLTELVLTISLAKSLITFEIGMLNRIIDTRPKTAPLTSSEDAPKHSDVPGPIPSLNLGTKG